jgi:hypothetical protein
MTCPLFVSGPFRGTSHWAIQQNIRASEAIALAAWRSELFSWVYCPHTLTAHYQDAAPDHVWLEGHLNGLRDVAKLGGMLIVTPAGHWTSTGTRAELEEAMRLGMPLFEAMSVSDDPAVLVTALKLKWMPGVGSGWHKVYGDTLLDEWKRRRGP